MMLNLFLKNRVEECEVISRTYGCLYLLSGRGAGLEKLQVLLMVIEPGARTSKHFHPSEELFYVIKGDVIFHSDNSQVEAAAREAVIVLPNQIHQVENASDKEPCEVLITLSPPRNPAEVVYCD